MDVANGSAAEEAEAHLRRADNGGRGAKYVWAFLAVDSPSHITHSLTHLLRTPVLQGLFASNFHRFSFRRRYQ